MNVRHHTLGRHTVRRALAAVAIAAAVVVVPALLVAIAGWPLPARLPDPERVTTAVRQGDLPADVIVKTLAVLVWICWAQLTWALTWEIAAQLRHPHDPPAHHRPPLVPRTVHRGVGRLVAFILAAGITVTTAPVSALTLRATAADLAPVPPSMPITADDGEAETAHQTVWVVAAGDTVWDIAERALGDGGRSSEILELNPTVAPRHLRVGHHLLLPTDAAIPTDRQPATATPATPATDSREDAPDPAAMTVVVDLPEAGYLPAETLTITVGDTLWSLAADRLDRADGPDTEPTGAEVAAYVDDVVETNSFRSGDPNLIHPGEHYTFPPIGTPPPAPADDRAPDPATAADEVEDEMADAAGDPAPVVAAEPVVPTPSLPATSTTIPPPTGAALSGLSPAAAAPTAGSESIDEADDRQQLVAGLAGATALATGLLLAHRRHRQRAARRGAAALHRPLPPRSRELVDELVRAADLPLVRWANHELATLMARLDPTGITGTPLAVELSTTHGIELLWDTPQPVAPAPWEAADGGWTWRLLYDPDHPVPSDPEIAPIAGLVTVGTRDDNHLLLNLEALGTVALTGDPTLAENLTRAIVLELASNPDLTTATCSIVGLAIDGDEHFWRAEHTDPDAARHRIATQQSGYRSLLDDSGLPTAFHTRIGDPFDRDVHVTVLGPDATNVLDDLDITRNLGVAVLTLGPSDHAQAIIDLHPDGTATLHPLGLTFHAAGIPARTATEIAVLLDLDQTDDELDSLDVAEAVDGSAAHPLDGDEVLESRMATRQQADTDGVSLDADELDADRDAAAEDMQAEQIDSPAETPAQGGNDPAAATLDLDFTFILDPGSKGDAREDEEENEADDASESEPVHLVRLLGVPHIDGLPRLGRLEMGIIAFIACNGGTATPEQVIDAVWGGKAIENGTFLNRLTKTRQAAPDVLLPRRHGTRELVLSDGVTTDIHLLERALRRAIGASSVRVIDLLRDGLALVEGVPFDDPTYDWAHDRQHHAHASTLIEQAALRLVDLALDSDDIDTARYAYRQGLRGLPLNEPLYRARMRTEAAAGNPDGIRAAYHELLNELANLDDGTGDLEPALETTRLHDQLTSTRSLRPTG
jgi:hypothetical protein